MVACWAILEKFNLLQFFHHHYRYLFNTLGLKALTIGQASLWLNADTKWTWHSKPHRADTKLRHQQPLYWLSRMNGSSSATIKKNQIPGPTKCREIINKNLIILFLNHASWWRLTTTTYIRLPTKIHLLSVGLAYIIMRKCISVHIGC